jgi:hypothetical protein
MFPIVRGEEISARRRERRRDHVGGKCAPGNCELEVLAQIGVSEAAMLSAFTSPSFR